MDPIEKAKGFLTEPSAAFETSKEDALEEAIKYYACLVAVYSALSAIVFAIIYSMLGPVLGKYGAIFGTGVTDVISSFFSSFVLMVIGALLWSAILHGLAYAMGGRKDILMTVKAVIYGSTPVALLGWIPVLGIVGWIWLFVLDVIGLKQYQELTTARSIVAVVIPIVVSFILAVVVFAAIVQVAISLGKFSG